jgi:hypothetical protein
MGAPTALGAKMMDGIDGLRQYLTLAEKDRMNMAGAPQMSPQHFEKLLPYAVALGVEKPWTETFDKWLAAAKIDDYQPGWYAGSNYGGFAGSVGGFSHSMASTIQFIGRLQRRRFLRRRWRRRRWRRLVGRTLPSRHKKARRFGVKSGGLFIEFRLTARSSSVPVRSCRLPSWRGRQPRFPVPDPLRHPDAPQWPWPASGRSWPACCPRR